MSQSIVVSVWEINEKEFLPEGVLALGKFTIQLDEIEKYEAAFIGKTEFRQFGTLITLKSGDTVGIGEKLQVVLDQIAGVLVTED